MKHEGDQGKLRQQTKTTAEQWKGIIERGSRVQYDHGVVWHRVVRGMSWQGKVKGEQ